MKGIGNSYDFGARMLDPRVGRWLSIDPKWRNFESITPYNFANNNPIKFIDRDGEDPIDFLRWLMFKAIPWVRDNYTSKGFAIKISSYKDISMQKKDQIMYKVGLVDGMLSTLDAADMVESQLEDFKDWLSSKPFEFDTFRQKSAEDLTNTILGPSGIGLKKQAEQITSIIENYDNLDEYTKGQIHGVILSTLAAIIIPEAANIRIAKLKINLSTNFSAKFKSSIRVNDLINTSEAIKIKPNAPEIYLKRSGNYTDALNDFNSLEGIKNIKPIEGKFDGYTGTLADGSTVTVRNGSSGNASGKSNATLQINPSKSSTNKQKTKIRYEKTTSSN